MVIKVDNSILRVITIIMSKDRKNANYKQVGLKRGNTYTTSWLPEEFCVEGKFVKLKQSDGTFQNGWQVTTVTDVVRTAKEADVASQMYKKTRKVSDI